MVIDQDAGALSGGAERDARRLSLIGLVGNGTMDLRLASLLWLLVEKRASIIVAAAPRLAGKTTVLNAILDLAPPSYRQVLTRGIQEDFSFLSETDPETTYILVPELSDHTPAYLWGNAVLTLFQALGRGYSLAATMHAESAAEVVQELARGPLRSSPELAGHLDAVVNLWMARDGDDVMRRVARLSLAMLSCPLDGSNVRSPAGSPGVEFLTLAERDPRDDSMVHADGDERDRALAPVLGMPQGEIAGDLHRREQALARWLVEGHAEGAQLRQAVLDYYGRPA